MEKCRVPKLGLPNEEGRGWMRFCEPAPGIAAAVMASEDSVDYLIWVFKRNDSKYFLNWLRDATKGKPVRATELIQIVGVIHHLTNELLTKGGNNDEET